MLGEEHRKPQMNWGLYIGSVVGSALATKLGMDAYQRLVSHDKPIQAPEPSVPPEKPADPVADLALILKSTIEENAQLRKELDTLRHSLQSHEIDVELTAENENLIQQNRRLTAENLHISAELKKHQQEYIEKWKKAQEQCLNLLEGLKQTIEESRGPKHKHKVFISTINKAIEDCKNSMRAVFNQ